MESSQHLVLGQWGEEQAARFLQRKGLRIIDRHYRQKWGEIDLICQDGDTWVFVEVKTRSRSQAPSALEAINRTKRQRVIRAALSYLKWKRLQGRPVRFDVVAITAGVLEWYPDAFEGSSHYTW